MKKNLLLPLLIGMIGCKSDPPVDTNNVVDPNIVSIYEDKSFYSREYPQYFIFRGDGINISDYDDWVDYSDDSASGFIRKFMYEEINIDGNTREYVAEYLSYNSDMIALLHLNGCARQVMADAGSDDAYYFPTVTSRYFPGHWVYKKGCCITNDLSFTDLRVSVENASLFTGKYINSNTTPYEYYDLFVIIVPLLEDGITRDWYNSEYCAVKEVDEENNVLVLDRAEVNSIARNFEAGARIAPIPGSVWGGNVAWNYNMATTCPTDADGKVASELYVEEIASWFADGGVLDIGIDGVVIDINYFEAKVTNADVNNDGVIDGGWVDGVNVWREGDWYFLCNLRETMGDDFIICGDAHTAESQQAVGILNGCESEGLVQSDDAWRGISRTFNTHLYWGENNTLLDLRYIVLKFQGDDAVDDDTIDRLSRYSVSVASSLGAYSTQSFSDDESDKDRHFMPEEFREPMSFGKITGDFIRIAKQSAAHTSRETLFTNAKGQNCDVEYSDGALIITPQSSCTDQNLVVEISNLTLPAGETTYYISGQGIDPLEGFDEDDLVPRLMWLVADNISTEYDDDIYGLYRTGVSSENSYYFRDGVATSNGTITLTIQGQGRFKITDMTLYNEPDIIARQFENVLILANPSTSEQSVTFEGKPYTIPQCDAIFITDNIE